MSASRWLTWTPAIGPVIEKSTNPELTKPPKVSSVSFVSSPPPVFSIIERQADGSTICPVHPASATLWHRQDGSAVCALCHPDPLALAARESAESGPPPMPDGVKLLRWEPKQPPIELTMFSVVTDPQSFIRSTLGQLEAALQGKFWAAGNRSVRDLCERLEQVGVRVDVAQKG